MGDTVWFRVDIPKSPLNDDRDHSTIYSLARELDALCSRLNVVKLSDLFDGSELELQFTGTIVEKRWFEAETALLAIEGLLEYLGANPNVLCFTGSRSHWRERLVTELSQAKTFLGNAQAAGRRIHFLIVP